MVTPFAGVWIEIVKCTMRIMLLVSLPSRECGLKFINFTTKDMKAKSLPSRECGLKFHVRDPPFLFCIVTPFAGVWIEMHLL